MILGTAAFGSVCGIVRDMNIGNKEIMSQFDLGDGTKKTLEKCFYEDSDGKLSEAFNSYTEGSLEYTQFSESIENMYQFFNGISAYKIWDEKFKNENAESVTGLQTELGKYQEGERFDTVLVKETLSEF